MVVKDIIENTCAWKILNNDIEENFYEFERKTRPAVLADGMLFESGVNRMELTSGSARQIGWPTKK